MIEWLVALLVLIGAALMLIATVGVLRFPDTITRLHAATKAGAVGVSFVMVAVAVQLSGSATLQALMVVAFVLLTAPVAAHTIARASYFEGMKLWEGTVRDDLRESGDVQRVLAEERWTVAEEEEEERREEQERIEELGQHEP